MDRSMFIRRLGSSPSPLHCSGGRNCPDILELANGDYAVIGTDITVTASPHLPLGSGCGATERIVQIPRSLVVRVRPELPEA